MNRTDISRELTKETSSASRRSPKILAITSGKGGVGKTNVVANTAVALSNLGQRVLVLDADLGLGNLDVLLGIFPKYNLEHVLLGQKKLSEIMMRGPAGIHILPASSGVEGLTALSPEQKLIILSELDRLEQEVDVLLIDTAAGISSNVIYFNMAAQEIILIASEDPASLTDAYAVMKVLSKQHGEKRFNLLVNRVRDESEAREVFRKLSLAAHQFLGIAIDYHGYIPEDDYLKMAVKQQKAVMDVYPHARSSRRFAQLARKIVQCPINPVPKGNVQFLWKQLLFQNPEEVGRNL